jgi:hypothetical protein
MQFASGVSLMPQFWPGTMEINIGTGSGSDRPKSKGLFKAPNET